MKVLKDNIELVKELYSKEHSVYEIADHFGVGKSSVHRFMIAEGIPLRPRNSQLKRSRIKLGNSKRKNGSVDNFGYVRIMYRGKFYKEHYVVWCRESEWGFVPEGFVIHHRNGNRTDNRIENLMCLPRDTHTAAHRAHERGKLKCQL